MRVLLFNLATDATDPLLGFATRWLERLAERVELIDVITMRAGQATLPENISVYSVGKEKGYSELRRVWEFYRILGKLLRRRRYDVCFAHMMPLFAVMAAPLLAIKKIPIVLWYTHKSVTWLLRLATLLAERILTASKESFRIESHKVRVLGHGIETEKFLPKDQAGFAPRPFTILTVGRLSPIKRVELLLDAVALIRQEKPVLPLCLRIVGGPATAQDQSYQVELQQRVAQQQLHDVVMFEGSVPFPEVVKYYQQADCFINLCPTGGMDKAVLEAMSCEVPVIVANQTFRTVLGLPLAETWVIKPEAAQLKERLLALAGMPPTERQQLGQRLREIVARHYDLERLCNRIVEELQAARNVTNLKTPLQRMSHK